MTSEVNGCLHSLYEDDLEGYVEHSQREFFEKLGRFRPNIDEFTYRRLCAEVFEGDKWTEAIDHFTRVTDELCMAVLEDNGRSALLKRMQKGAEMIENESDPIKKLKFRAVYEALEKELNRLDGA